MAGTCIYCGFSGTQDEIEEHAGNCPIMFSGFESEDFEIKNEFGYCSYSFENDKRGNYVHIYNLYVYPNFRKRGKAREILQTVINNIRKIGYNGGIWIVANPKENSIELDKLVEFYKSMGLTVFSAYR